MITVNDIIYIYICIFYIQFHQDTFFHGYPPVNVYITNWQNAMLLMGKSTISTGPWLQQLSLFCAPPTPPEHHKQDTPLMDFAGDLLELLLLVLAGRHLIIVRHLGRKDGMRNCMGNNDHKWKIMTIKKTINGN